MFLKSKMIFALCLVASLLAGCGPVVIVDFPYKGFLAASTQAPTNNTKPIWIKNVVDRRGTAPDYLTTLKFGNCHRYGCTDKYSTFIASQPVGLILNESIRDALNHAGYRIARHTSETPLELSTDLLQLSVTKAEGYVTASLTTSLVVQFILTDVSTRRTIWVETVSGHGVNKINELYQGFTAQHMREAIKPALDELTRKLIASKAFQKALKQRP